MIPSPSDIGEINLPDIPVQTSSFTEYKSEITNNSMSAMGKIKLYSQCRIGSYFHHFMDEEMFQEAQTPGF